VGVGTVTGGWTIKGIAKIGSTGPGGTGGRATAGVVGAGGGGGGGVTVVPLAGSCRT
jgi:hypothetical protein